MDITEKVKDWILINTEEAKKIFLNNGYDINIDEVIKIYENYLDRIKQIKKGCKIFKRGLKKRDEKQIFDGIYHLARKNRKKFTIIIFKFDKYKK